MASSKKAIQKKAQEKEGSKKGATTEPKAVDWKDPKLLAEMGVAALIIVVFMGLTGGFAGLMN